MLMSNRSTFVVGAAVIVGCSMLVGCDSGGNRGTADDTPAPAELRTYAVAPELKAEMLRMLRLAVERGTGLGWVTDGPGDTLIVVAPARIQSGIADMLDAGFTPSPAPSSVKLTYWLLVGRPLDTGNEPASFRVAGSRRLNHLEPVMTQLVAAQGSSEFALLEEIQVLSMVQDQGQATGKTAQVEQTVTQAGERIVAYVSIALPTTRYSFESQVSLRPEQYLVVGQVGLDDSQVGFFRPDVGPFPDSRAEDDLTLYYVMMAELAP